jgi:hypothetical protein
MYILELGDVCGIVCNVVVCDVVGDGDDDDDDVVVVVGGGDVGGLGFMKECFI